MNIYDKLASLFRSNRVPPTVEPELVQMGVIEKSGFVFLCSPRFDVKGAVVKLITVPRSFAEREKIAVVEFYKVQHDLKQFPTSLRPRRSRKASDVQANALARARAEGERNMTDEERAEHWVRMGSEGAT